MKNVLFILSIVLISSCASQKKVVISPYTIWVKGVQVDCTGVGPMKCLQVQKNEIIEPGEWQNFYSPIEGFQYKNGTRYKLLVSEEKLDPAKVPADGSSIKYKLVEVLENKPEPIFALHDIWVLEAIENNPLQTQGNNTSFVSPSIEINITEMKVMGTDGCNQFFGPINSVEDDILEFGNMAGTMKMCINMEIPNSFNKALAQVRKYKRDGLKLHLLDESETEVLRFKKVD